MEEEIEATETIEPLKRLARDIRSAAKTLSRDEARFLVDLYYTMQEHRIATAGQTRSLVASGEPHATIDFFGAQMKTLEGQVKSALDAYSEADELGQWARSVVGIGPVISAGLLAHIDVAKAPSYGNVWSFAGLNPTVKWEKGQKRPWNAALKTLCWKIGESFVKVSGRDDAFYGKVYAEAKERYQRENGELAYADAAAASLKAKKIGKDTEAFKAYNVGLLPPAHIHARAKRYAVKLFLSHYWEKGRVLAGLPVPEPYPIAHLGHAHVIAVPGNGSAPGSSPER